ncbi:MAG: YncE family protein [Myxococcota bacterium]
MFASRVSVLGSVLALAASLVCLGACSGNAQSVADYEGDAYPNRRPKLESPGHVLGYLANRFSDSISVVDLDERRLVGSAPVGRDPVDIDGPRHVVLDRAARLAYVVYSYPNSNISPHASSLGTNGRLGYVAALDLTDLSPLGELRLDVSPGDLALSGSGRLAISHFDTLKALDTTSIESRRANVALVQPATALARSQASASRVSVCAVPAAIAFGADGSRLFVACMGEDSLAVVDAETASVIARVPAGDIAVNQPYALVRNMTGDRLLLSNQVAGTVVQFSSDDTPQVLSIARFTEVPFFAEFVSEREFVVALQNPDGSARVELASGTVLMKKSYSETECVKPTQPRQLADGRLFLICQGDGHSPGALVELDPATLAIQTRIEVGVWPERMEILEP